MSRTKEVLSLVDAVRRRQTQKHGFDLNHDRNNYGFNDQLVEAGIAYALHSTDDPESVAYAVDTFPWSEPYAIDDRLPRLDRLVRGISLLVAQAELLLEEQESVQRVLDEEPFDRTQGLSADMDGGPEEEEPSVLDGGPCTLAGVDFGDIERRCLAHSLDETPADPNLTTGRSNDRAAQFALAYGGCPARQEPRDTKAHRDAAGRFQRSSQALRDFMLQKGVGDSLNRNTFI